MKKILHPSLKKKIVRNFSIFEKDSIEQVISYLKLLTIPAIKNPLTPHTSLTFFSLHSSHFNHLIYILCLHYSPTIKKESLSIKTKKNILGSKYINRIFTNNQHVTFVPI